MEGTGGKKQAKKAKAKAKRRAKVLFAPFDLTQSYTLEKEPAPRSFLVYRDHSKERREAYSSPSYRFKACKISLLTSPFANPLLLTMFLSSPTDSASSPWSTRPSSFSW